MPSEMILLALQGALPGAAPRAVVPSSPASGDFPALLAGAAGSSAAEPAKPAGLSPPFADAGVKLPSPVAVAAQAPQNACNPPAGADVIEVTPATPTEVTTVVAKNAPAPNGGAAPGRPARHVAAELAAPALDADAATPPPAAPRDEANDDIGADEEPAAPPRTEPAITVAAPVAPRRPEAAAPQQPSGIGAGAPRGPDAAPHRNLARPDGATAVAGAVDVAADEIDVPRPRRVADRADAPLAAAPLPSVAVPTETPALAAEPTVSITPPAILPPLPDLREPARVAEVVEAWADQIGAAFSASPVGELLIGDKASFRLTPASLGELDVRIHLEQGVARVELAVSSDAARAALEPVLPRLVQLLEERSSSFDTATGHAAADGRPGTAPEDRMPRGRSHGGGAGNAAPAIAASATETAPEGGRFSVFA